MKPHQSTRHILSAVCALAAWIVLPAAADAQGTAFTFQGKLVDGGNPADGFHNIDVTLKDALSGGNTVAGPVSLANVPVSDGIFTVQLDFGAAAYSGGERWLEVAVNGTPLSPRQPLSPAPLALGLPNVFTDGSGNVGMLRRDRARQSTNRSNMKIKQHSAGAALLILGASSLSSGFLRAQVYLDPYGGTFEATGGSLKPFNRLDSAIAEANGGTVRHSGGTRIYGSVTIDQAVTLESVNGVTIGVTPVAEATFRCLFYNVRLSGGGNIPGGWADQQRAEAIRDKYAEWGSPDFAGFCEVWNTDPMWNSYLSDFGGGSMPHEIDGMNLNGAGQDSGLAAKSAYPPTSPQTMSPPLPNDADDRFGDATTNDASRFYRGEFTDGSGFDFQASKGWIRTRIVKDGFGIWAFVTHMQADDSVATWTNVYASRRKQMQEIAADIEKLQEEFPNDVFFIMGDFNVYGDARGPNGSPNQNEYLDLKVQFAAPVGDAVPNSDGAMDVARQFAQSENHDIKAYTFSTNNSLARYFYDPPATAFDTDCCAPLGDSSQARLDYIFALGSADGKVVIEATNYEVIRGMSPIDITEGDTIWLYDHVDRNLSDHYGVAADFKIMRVAD